VRATSAALPEHDQPVSVLLVTQIRLYADGIAGGLEEIDGIGRVGAEPSCSTGLERLRHESFDVVVLDVAGIDDIAEAQAFTRAASPSRVVALAVREHDHEVVAWAEHGATGIVTRQASFDDLLRAIFAAARGECHCSPRVAGALVRRLAEGAAERGRIAAHTPLTLRELEIAELLIAGLSNKDIAVRLLLGVSTVKNHVHNILGKVEAHTRSEAVARLVAERIRVAGAQETGSSGA
jgi:two-component system, NarL family, nitrate/nitrite response regulator NarL